MKYTKELQQLVKLRVLKHLQLVMVLVTKDFLFTLTAQLLLVVRALLQIIIFYFRMMVKQFLVEQVQSKFLLAQQVRDQEVLLLVCLDTTAPKESLKDTPQSGERLVEEEVLRQQHTLLTMLL